MSTEKRLDRHLADSGLARSRTAAQHLIRDGLVRVDGQVRTSVSTLVDEASIIQVSGGQQYLSRAALKLQAALTEFQISTLYGRPAIDLGASTGGFTQVLLERGASAVFSVDVGRDQLASELREDPRVFSLESTDARSIRSTDLLEMLSKRRPDQAPLLRAETDFGLITIDVSFISLRYLIPHLTQEFPSVPVIALFKPQFEVGRARLGKGGVVTDEKLHLESLIAFSRFLFESGAGLRRVIESPIAGMQGNREFLLWITLDRASHVGELSQVQAEEMIRFAVSAHNT